MFQNKSYDIERQGGYLWAPKATCDGKQVSHWAMMKKVHKGDIIFHSVNKNIVAISIASSDCYSKMQPDRLKAEEMWNDDGYKVDCKYIDVGTSIITSNYKNKILELQPNKYAPFNKLGRGNTGYLFASNFKLSKFLFSKLILVNPKLKYFKEELEI